MNQLKRWVENKSAGAGSSRPNLNLRTSNSYDCEERFSIVALNMLSRYEYFGMKPEDAIRETLVTPKDRSCFLEALNVRKMYSHQHEHHLSPSTVNLVKTVECNFGKDLTRMVEKESSPCGNMGNTSHIAMGAAGYESNNTPITREQQNAVFQAQPCLMIQRKCSQTHQGRGKRISTSKGQVPRAFFFPDTTSLFSVTSSKVTARNIDWKLAEAIEQVSSLRLDGMPMSPTTTCSTVSSGMSYEPPVVK